MTELKRLGKNIKLVVFDVEGVLIEAKVPLIFSGGGYLLIDAARRKGLSSFIQFSFISLLYYLRLFPTDTAIRRAFKLLEGLERRVFQEIFDGFLSPPGLLETFRALKEYGAKIALMSYGIPSFLVRSLANKVGAEYAYGVDLEIENEHATGEISGLIGLRDGKVLALDEICQLEAISPEECAVIADDRSNQSLFQTCGLSIGFNPDREISRCADIVVETENLSGILPALQTPSIMSPEIRSFTLHDFSRLLFHISGLWVPYLGLLLGVPPLLFLIGLTTVVYGASEFLRLEGSVLPIITDITTFAARRKELRQFVLAPVYFAFGIFLALLFFPNSYGFAGIAVLTLGDSTASFFGGWMGRTRLPYNKHKSVEGTLAGFIMGILGGALFINLYLAAIGSFVGMLIESLPMPFDDNALVPISAAAVMYLIAFLL
jgi:phosphoserine phosphatase